jgi:outer membrane protein TolC
MPCVASRLLPFAFAVAFAPRVAHAEVVKLEDLEARAVQNRASVASARARVGGSDARIALAKVPYYPTVDLKTSAIIAPGGRIISVYTTDEIDKAAGTAKPPAGSPYSVSGSKAFGDPGAFDPNFHYEATLTVASRLYDFGRTASSVDAARSDREAMLAGVRSEQSAVTFEVRTAYLGWLSAHGTRAILAQNAADATALRVHVEATIAEGSRAGADIAAARYQEARAALDLEKSESDLDSARQDLEQATGTALSRNAEPDESLFDREPPSAPPSHPDVAFLERRSSAFAASAKAHGHPYMPILGFTLDAGIRGQGYTPFPVYDAGLTLAVPIFDGGLEAGNAGVARAQANDFAAQAREAQNKTAVQTERSRSLLARASKRLELAQTLVGAADEQVTHAEDQHELGSATFDTVVQARMQAERARLEVLAARLDHVRAVLDLSDANAH